MAVVTHHTAPAGRQFLKLCEVVQLASCHENTIRRASDAGELKAYRLPSGHRRWNRAHVLEWLGIEDSAEEVSTAPAQILIYARVSSHKQSKGINEGSFDNDLGRQIERLKKLALENYKCSTPVIYSDTFSGLSFTRKGLLRLLNEVLKGKFNNSILLCTHKDRLARFGTEVILEVCKFRNVEVIFTEKEMDESQEKELADDLIAIIQHFAARTYGARASRTTAKILSADTVKRAKELHDAGNSVWQIEEKLAADGFKTEGGSRISKHAIGKYVVHNKLLLEILPPRPKTNLQEYCEQCLEPAEPHARISTKAVYDHYCRWCKKHKEPAAKINKLSHQLGKLGYKRAYQIGDGRAKGYSGLKIKGEQFHQHLKQIRKGSALYELMKQR